MDNHRTSHSVSRRALMGATLALALPSHAAFAQELTGTARETALTQAQNAFNALRSVAGRFSQTDARGRTVVGDFMMQRPNKLRLNYDPPTQQVMIADGTNVSIRDLRLRSTNRYAQSATPLRFLLSDQLNLRRDVRVERVSQEGGQLIIRVRDARRPRDGALEVRFDTATNALEEWRVFDRQNQMTIVRLSNLRSVGSFPAGTFVGPPLPSTRRQ